MLFQKLSVVGLLTLTSVTLFSVKSHATIDGANTIKLQLCELLLRVGESPSQNYTIRTVTPLSHLDAHRLAEKFSAMGLNVRLSGWKTKSAEEKEVGEFVFGVTSFNDVQRIGQVVFQHESTFVRHKRPSFDTPGPLDHFIEAKIKAWNEAGLLKGLTEGDLQDTKHYLKLMAIDPLINGFTGQFIARWQHYKRLKIIINSSPPKSLEIAISIFHHSIYDAGSLAEFMGFAREQGFKLAEGGEFDISTQLGREIGILESLL